MTINTKGIIQSLKDIQVSQVYIANLPGNYEFNNGILFHLHQLKEIYMGELFNRLPLQEYSKICDEIIGYNATKEYEKKKNQTIAQIAKIQEFTV